MQQFLHEQEQRSSSMIKTDPIIGEVTRGTKPVLEPMPDVKPLPDGFRYKPDLANASAQALHFEQCIERVRELSEKQVRKIISNLRKQYVDVQYQSVAKLAAHCLAVGPARSLRRT